MSKEVNKILKAALRTAIGEWNTIHYLCFFLPFFESSSTMLDFLNCWISWICIICIIRLRCTLSLSLFHMSWSCPFTLDYSVSAYYHFSLDRNRHDNCLLSTLRSLSSLILTGIFQIDTCRTCSTRHRDVFNYYLLHDQAECKLCLLIILIHCNTFFPPPSSSSVFVSHYILYPIDETVILNWTDGRYPLLLSSLLFGQTLQIFSWMNLKIGTGETTTE